MGFNRAVIVVRFTMVRSAGDPSAWVDALDQFIIVIVRATHRLHFFTYNLWQAGHERTEGVKNEKERDRDRANGSESDSERAHSQDNWHGLNISCRVLDVSDAQEPRLMLQ